MANATSKPVESIRAELHAADPILSKRTDLYGRVDVYPPNAPTSQWSILSFLITSEHGLDNHPKGLHEYIKAKYIYEAFERPHFINDYMKFGHQDKDA